LLEDFHRAQALSHRNIVNLHELDRDGDIVFFTMELLEGETLANVIRGLRPNTLARNLAWQLLRQLGAGLAHAHERGVVHGDLKPDNIFITNRGELRILGFGGARTLPPFDATHGWAASTRCTLAYASCEQLEGRRPDPRDDLYALACISYELLAGEHPFDSRVATLARDYRVALVRPRGLTGRQWRALQQGLSWHRAGRSISVRSWMQRLMFGNLHEDSLTPLRDFRQPDRTPTGMARPIAAMMLAVTVAGAAILTQLRSTSAPTVPAPLPALSVAATRDIPPPALVIPAIPAGLPIATAQKIGPRNDFPAISVEADQIAPDDHFAEIRLHRNALQKGESFTWWTEPATAKPGVDYLPEAVAVQTFPSGFRATRLYVRLLPQPLRSHRSFFYVAIAEVGPRKKSGGVIRRQVWLPAAPNLQARR
jgi:hypothetical protein